MSVKGVDSGLRLSGVGHRNEAESFAATGHTIGYDTNGGNFAECCERRFETIVGRRISEVTNIDFHLYFPSVYLNAPSRKHPPSQMKRCNFINFTQFESISNHAAIYSEYICLKSTPSAASVKTADGNGAVLSRICLK